MPLFLSFKWPSSSNIVSWGLCHSKLFPSLVNHAPLVNSMLIRSETHRLKVPSLLMVLTTSVRHFYMGAKFGAGCDSTFLYFPLDSTNKITWESMHKVSEYKQVSGKHAHSFSLHRISCYNQTVRLGVPVSHWQARVTSNTNSLVTEYYTRLQVGK